MSDVRLSFFKQGQLAFDRLPLDLQEIPSYRKPHRLRISVSPNLRTVVVLYSDVLANGDSVRDHWDLFALGPIWDSKGPLSQPKIRHTVLENSVGNYSPREVIFDDDGERLFTISEDGDYWIYPINGEGGVEKPERVLIRMPQRDLFFAEWIEKKDLKKEILRFALTPTSLLVFRTGNRVTDLRQEMTSDIKALFVDSGK